MSMACWNDLAASAQASARMQLPRRSNVGRARSRSTDVWTSAVLRGEDQYCCDDQAGAHDQAPLLQEKSPAGRSPRGNKLAEFQLRLRTGTSRRSAPGSAPGTRCPSGTADPCTIVLARESAARASADRCRTALRSASRRWSSDRSRTSTTAVSWLNRFSTLKLSCRLRAAADAERVLHEEVGLREHRRAAVAAAAEVVAPVVARREDAELTRHRQAARDVLVHADARAEGELVDELRLELVRPIGRPAGRRPACRRPGTSSAGSRTGGRRSGWCGRSRPTATGPSSCHTGGSTGSSRAGTSCSRSASRTANSTLS